MKRIPLVIGGLLTIIIGPLLTIIVLSVVANNFIRVSDGTYKSIGIVEHILFGKSISEVLSLPRSENYKRWEKAANGSEEIKHIITQYGRMLNEDPELEGIRANAEKLSRISYENAEHIDLDYLRESNPELPGMYKVYFVGALLMWSNGFAEKDYDKILNGNEAYNIFLLWVQSQDRNDFKNIK